MKKIYTFLAVVVTSFGFAQQYQLVTNQNDLQIGSKYLIVGQNTSTGSNANKVYVMTIQNTNNRASEEITGLNSIPATIEFDNTYTSLTLGGGTVTETHFTFFDNNYGENGGYLYAASSSNNYLKTQVENNTNGEFSIAIETNGSATIIAQGSNTRKNLRFNGTNSPALFSCYSSGQMNVYLYKEVANQTVSPTAIIDSSSLTNFSYVENQGPSLPQTISVLISDLPGEETATLALDSTDFTIVSPTNLALGNGTHNIQLLLKDSLAVDTYSANLTITHDSTQLATLELTGEVTGIPVVISDNLNITELNYVEGQGPSTEQSFNISGNYLDGTDVILTATTDFEISIDNTTFGTSVTLEEFDGTSTLIYTRLVNELAVDTYTGNITVTGGGLTESFLISLSGEVTEDPTASIVENNIEGLNVYPNPATDLVNIVSNEIGTKEVTIFNMLGKKVLETSTEETVNVSTLTSGVYIMNITQDGKKASRKLVIK